MKMVKSLLLIEGSGLCVSTEGNGGIAGDGGTEIISPGGGEGIEGAGFGIIKESGG